MGWVLDHSGARETAIEAKAGTYRPNARHTFLFFGGLARPVMRWLRSFDLALIPLVLGCVRQPAHFPPERVSGRFMASWATPGSVQSKSNSPSYDAQSIICRPAWP